MDTPIITPMSRYDAAVNAERLVNEARHAQRPFEDYDARLASLLLQEAQVYATLATRPYV